MEDEGGGGGGGGYDPAADAVRHEREEREDRYGPPPPDNYDPGPPPYQNYYNRPPGPARGSGRPAPPPDPWAGVPGSDHDQAVAWTDTFARITGAPGFVDWNDVALRLAKTLMSVAGAWGAYDAYEWLWNNALDDIWRINNPWARYGLDKDTYGQTVSKLNSVMFDWTGNELSADQLHDAIRGSWTPDQIRNVALYGNPSGGGELLESARFEGENPWLSLGQTYTQTRQSFESFEQHAPADKETLAAFFRFGVSAKQVGAGAGARTVAGEGRVQTAEVR